MSTYYDMSISGTMYVEIESAILSAIQHEENTFDIIELVHLLDAWEETKEEARAELNKELQKWYEQQKLFEKSEFDNIFLFSKIKDVLKNNNVELDLESEFHLVCDLAEMFEKEWRKRDENKHDE